MYISEDSPMSRSSIASPNSSTLSSQSQRALPFQLERLTIINSFFHSYCAPPVVFSITKKPIEGYMTRLRIERKQYLTSIQRDFDGQVRHIVPLVPLVLS